MEFVPFWTQLLLVKSCNNDLLTTYEQQVCSASVSDPWWLCSFCCVVQAETTVCKNRVPSSAICTLHFAVNATNTPAKYHDLWWVNCYVPYATFLFVWSTRQERSLQAAITFHTQFFFFFFLNTSRMSANFIPVILLICKTDGWKQTLSTNTYTGDMQCLHKSTSDTQTCKNIQSKMQTQLSHTHSSPPPHLCAL